MYKDLQNIIDQSTFTVQPGRYIYAKVRTAPSVEDHFFVSKDSEGELTVVTREERVDTLDLIEKNKEYYALIAINVSVPFYSVGLLATISRAIAKMNMDILIVSTYSKDFIMVSSDEVEAARGALVELGFRHS